MFSVRSFIFGSRIVNTFNDLQEIFDPFSSREKIDESNLGIDNEIEIINKEIDEVLEFYFDKDVSNNHVFSWEK